ncbi:4-hydroxy-2-oxoheptanedioate aldolase [Rhizobium tibeticum]|uniref:2-keto-3-deoxy-L-rhamnonate aldolase n=1 Tax=Rhizobium tibeticum TaxID=501024 RepID=A0A1H8RUC2_9HYPH|nr:aldolase/citrate lyase family protein [Rhizobium tibeticum]SEI08451.1 2-keto-3-deoxy-L-rhamnonate aldolase [Rhizobium tibeticum]SEO69916.1 4-hydroxy-2-oxoheptanedioate aldolase [Rhizobium tibeticum]
MTGATTIDGFAKRIRSGEGGLISAWIGIPDPLFVNHLAQEAFDAVVLDMQHGVWDIGSAAVGIGQGRLAGKPVLARIPLGDFASASRLLDMGASGIIAPMINSVSDAEAFAKATKYLPLGERSWGPTLAMNHTGLSATEYLATANLQTVAIAMIETRAALDAADEIMRVDGIDGIFVGPSDLSIALSDGAKVAPDTAQVDGVLKHLIARCRAHGKFACVFGSNGERAGELLKMGFDFVIAGADTQQLRSGAASAIAAARRVQAS